MTRERAPERPFVSIIVPAHNEQRHLANLLASLRQLDFPREQLEIIVVDHASTDNTRAVALEGGARVIPRTGGTISGVRNAGAAAATGSFLAFVDADCTVAPDWLSRALSHFADPTVAMVGRSYVVPLDPPTWVRKVRCMLAESRPALADVRWLPAGNMIVRREVFRELGGFDEALVTCEDVDLCHRLTQKYRIVADQSVRCYHYGEPKSFREMFRKELWRGRANFAGVARHGLSLAELPSLVLPSYFSLTLAVFLVSPLIALLTAWSLARCLLLAGGVFVLPLLAISAMASLRAGGLRYVLPFAVFYGFYFIARGLAPFYAWRHVS